VHREGELDGAQVRPEVAVSGSRDGVDDELADLGCEGMELLVGEPADVVGPVQPSRIIVGSR
jgi:hypothetical protein